MNCNPQEGDIVFFKQELSEYSKRSFARGLVCGTGGNLSIRIPGSNTVLITPTGASLEDMTPDGAILVNLAGEIIDSPQGLKPSKEASFHLKAYQIRPDVQALAHLHPPYATAYSNKETSLPLVTVSARANLTYVPVVETALPGSRELCDFVCAGLEQFPDVKAILMKEHGILTLGRDLKTAYYLADLVEETAKIAFIEGNIRR